MTDPTVQGNAASCRKHLLSIPNLLWSAFLRVNNLPLGMEWDKFMLASGFSSLLTHNIKAQRMLLMEEWDSCTIWLQMASKTDALQTRGFLTGQNYRSECSLECSFVTEDEFKENCLVTIQMKALGNNSSTKNPSLPGSPSRSMVPSSFSQHHPWSCSPFHQYSSSSR